MLHASAHARKGRHQEMGAPRERQKLRYDERMTEPTMIATP